MSSSSAVVGDLMVKLDNPTAKWIAVGAAAAGASYVAVKMSWFRKNPLKSFGGKTGAMAKDLVDAGINSYNAFFDQEDGKGVGSRILSTPEFVDKFYSLITDFYEYGWGESFHFAARDIGESFEASIIRQETAIAETIGLKPGMKVLDIGCGVGGPMRNIVKHTGGHVTGITINEYQVERCLKLNKAAGVSDLTAIKQGNFMDLDKVFEGAGVATAGRVGRVLGAWHGLQSAMAAAETAVPRTDAGYVSALDRDLGSSSAKRRKTS